MFPLAQTLAQALPEPGDPLYEAYSVGWLLEPVVFVGAAFLTYRGLVHVWPFGLHRLFLRRSNPGVGVVRVSVIFAIFWAWFVLQTGAASDIVGYYTLGYAALALAVLLWAGFRVPIVRVYYRADVLERGNLAAALTLAGFALGTAFAYGGALTGEGPGWWIVVVFFALAYFELRANMGLVARLGQLDEDMRLERDPSAGALLGAVAMASGLVAGRAAAGDFTGWERDLPDYFRRLWPLLPIAFVGVGVGTLTRFSASKVEIRLGASAALVLGGLFYYFLT